MQADRTLLVKRAKSSEKRVKELEQELAASQSLLAKEKAARDTAEEKSRKTGEELKEAQKNDKCFRKESAEAAQKAVNSFLKVLMGVGDETEPPAINVSVPESLGWLSSGLHTLSDLLDLGQEYSAVEATRALVKSLNDLGCDHVDRAEAGEAATYWDIDTEPHNSAVQFFDAFWRAGGHDLTLYRAALSRAMVRPWSRLQDMVYLL